MKVYRQAEGGGIGTVPPIPKLDSTGRVDRMDVETSCDHVAHSGPGWTVCVNCGTKCVRDAVGDIESYDRGIADLPPAIAAQHLKERQEFEAHHVSEAQAY